MTAAELLLRYAAGERNFRGVDLTGANLTGAKVLVGNRTVTIDLPGEVHPSPSL